MIKCLIIDDDELSRKHLAHLCSKIEDIHVIEMCSSGMEAITALEKQPVDLLLLDIEMPDFSGLELVKSIRNLPQIIFTTSHPEFALEAFEYNVTDYLTKPILLPRLIKAIDKVKGRLSPKRGHHKPKKELFIRTNGKLLKLNQQDILFIETMDDYLLFHTQDGKKYPVHSTLSKMAEKLKDTSFLKVHRSFIVNLKKISSIEDTHVQILKKVIPVSRAHRNALMKQINLL